jgi:hypothetical protein
MFSRLTIRFVDKRLASTKSFTSSLGGAIIEGYRGQEIHLPPAEGATRWSKMAVTEDFRSHF